MLLTLPVGISVGGTSAVVGTVTLDPDAPVGPQLADLLTALAAAVRTAPADDHQEVSPDGTA